MAGSTLTVIYFYYFLVARTKKAGDDFSHNGILQKLAQSSDERGTAIIKRAGTRKVNKMLLNARRMHGSKDQDGSNIETNPTRSKRFGQVSQTVFQTYVLYGEDKELCGGWAWTFRRLFSKELFEVEGIWFPSRLWTFQVMQCVVLALLCVLVPILITTAVQNAEDANQELPDDLPSWVYDFVPTSWQVRVSLVPSAFIALAVCVCIILLYIPR